MGEEGIDAGVQDLPHPRMQPIGADQKVISLKGRTTTGSRDLSCGFDLNARIAGRLFQNLYQPGAVNT